jgi:hypothetical protein
MPQLGLLACLKSWMNEGPVLEGANDLPNVHLWVD